METKQYLLVAGITIFAYLAPEVMVAAFKVRVPVKFNILSGIAGACLTLYFVL